LRSIRIQVKKNIENFNRILEEDYQSFIYDILRSEKQDLFKELVQTLSIEYAIYFDEIELSGNDLIPIQNEIDVDILTQSMKNTTFIKQILNCKEKPLSLGKTKIVTSNGKYIVDGANLWALIYLINPECKIPSLNLPDLHNPLLALRSMYFGLLSTTTKIKLQPKLNGKNLFTIDIHNFAKIFSKISEEIVDLFKYFKVAENKEEVGIYIYKNLRRLQAVNTPFRNGPSLDQMPQTIEQITWVKHAFDIERYVDLTLSVVEDTKNKIENF
jgi:hypothetical protein